MKTAIYVALMVWYGFSVLAVISGVGKPRKPSTPEVAATTVVILGLLAAGVTYLAWSGT